MIGRSLRQYLVTEQLGQGGMGVVWKARDTILDRDVAVKVLPNSEGNAVARKERFFREAKAASALNHPSIITIYEINSDHGIDFIAMEYVHGQTLAALLRSGRMAIPEAVRYAIQIAEAVGRAHSAGIVHRDLKPGNIMVTVDGLVKVLDFGLAKVGHPAADTTSGGNAGDSITQMALTTAGTTVGTIGYMSPEQAIGDVVDARSDVFSFGVIFYEMLAGKRPFEGESRIDLLRVLHFTEPPSLASLRPDIPPTLTTIVARALAKKPADRYANLTEIAAALRSFTSAEFVVSAEPSSAKFYRRGIGRAMAARRSLAYGLGAVLIAGGIGVVAWRSRQAVVPAAQPAPATAPADQPGGPYELTVEAASLLVRQDREGNVDRAVSLLERALSQDKEFATAYAHLSEAYLRRHRRNPDVQWLTQARETAQRAIALNPDLALAHQALGFAHLEAGEYPDAVGEFRRAADLDPVSALPHVGLGMTLFAQDQDTDAAAAFRKAIQLAPQDWRPHIEFGQFFFRRSRYAEAAEEWEAARKLTPDNILVLRNLGAVYYHLGRNDEAASTFQRALEVRPSAPIYTNLGTIRFFQGRYADAVAAFEKAVELGANNHLYWGNLGDGYRWTPGRRADAPAAYRRASALIQQQITQKPNDPDLRTRHAAYLVKLGDTAAALKEIEPVVTQFGLSSQILYRLTVVYELAGDRARALGALERALNAGYSVKELDKDPELIRLRADARYHRLLDAVVVKSGRS